MSHPMSKSSKTLSRQRATTALVVALLSLSATACSSLSWLNPFASSPKHKPAELKNFSAIAELQQDWRQSMGKSESAVMTPAVIGQSVYAAAADGRLARFDQGREVWRIDLDKPLSGAVGSNGKQVAVGTLKGELLVLDAATGKALWQAQVSSEILAAPVLNDELVVVRSGDFRVYGFEARTGQRRWVFQRSTPTLSLRSNAGVVLTDKAIIGGFPGGKLIAISPVNGAALWEASVAQPRGTTELERVADVASLPVVQGSTVCAVAFQGRAACFELGNGRPLWGRDISSHAGLSMDDKAVYVAEETGIIQAYDRHSGAAIWKQSQLTYRGLSRPLALGRYVAVADGFGVVHLLSRTNGAFAARRSTDGSAILADPQAYGKEGLLVQTRDGDVVAMSAH